MDKLVTIVMTRDGKLHLASDITVADAERWAESGYHVFRLVTQKEKFAINHVNSGKVFTSDVENNDSPLTPLLLKG